MPGGTAIDNESEPEGGELAPIHVTSAPALASSSTAARGSSLLSSPPMAARLNIRRLGRRSASLLPRPPSRPFPWITSPSLEPCPSLASSSSCAPLPSHRIADSPRQSMLHGSPALSGRAQLRRPACCSFSVSDANNEVVCPLTNNDGSNCRKRCLGEKRFRSMQEHIRRAHPSHYIPKLPATEESFLLMVNTPLDQRAHLNPQAPPSTQPKKQQPAVSDRDIYVADASSPVTSRTIDDAHPAAATAAVALAQLHHNRLASDWEDTHSDNDIGRDRMRSSIELPPLRDHFKQESLPPFQPSRPRELLPSILHSPPGRSSTLPPIQRRDRIQRPRKSSITKDPRRPKHERTRSKEYGRRPSLGDRKALSAEPQTAAWAQGKRWEDLIEAATSATEADDDRDLTP
ncbi:hypothetical protein T310_0752, partial [Rasamsonia emersonii CBS 393.64]